MVGSVDRSRAGFVKRGQREREARRVALGGLDDVTDSR
jgi:hypothetical protein